MNLIERNECVFTGVKDLNVLTSFENFPVFMGCTDKPIESDLFADMTWVISPSTGTLQLNSLIPLDILYNSQHAGAVGETWKKHHRSFAKFIAKFNPQSIFEIGGAHGLLSLYYGDEYKEIPWKILEPNPAPKPGVKAEFEQGFFDSSYETTFKFDTIVHSHVFEHVYSHRDFIKHLSQFSDLEQKHIFSIPNMKAQLRSFYTNCLNFEHTAFLTEPYVEYLLELNGYEVLEKEYYLEHSIFYSTKKVSEGNPQAKIPNDFELNKRLWDNFVSYHQELIADLNSKIDAHKGPIYLFGAHIFSQFLLYFGLNHERIKFILDNDKNKQNKRLYGTNLTVKDPEVLRGQENVGLILKAGIYNNEIMEDINKNINNTVKYWE